MKHTTLSSAGRRAWAGTVLSDFTEFTVDQLVQEASRLHADLAEVERGGFGRTATLGIRQVIVRQLLAIDDAHARRAHPPSTPRTLRDRTTVARPTAA